MLQSLAAVGVLGSLTSEAGATTTAPRSRTAAHLTSGRPAPPWSLLAPLQAGSPLGLGWSIVDLEPVRRGAAILILTGPDQAEARLHLCRRDGAPHGIAWTPEIDLVLMNGGTGRRLTNESLGRAVRSLADRMKGPAPTDLLSHDERLEAYAGDHEALT